MKTWMSRVFLLTLVVALSGAAWAVADSAELPAVPVEEAESPQVETPDLLLPEMEEADACCFADCYDAWAACLAECGTSIPCRQACAQERNQCTSNC